MTGELGLQVLVLTAALGGFVGLSNYAFYIQGRRGTAAGEPYLVGGAVCLVIAFCISIAII